MIDTHRKNHTRADPRLTLIVLQSHEPVMGYSSVLVTSLFNLGAFDLGFVGTAPENGDEAEHLTHGAAD